MNTTPGLLAALLIASSCSLVAAQFTTIHNLPPDPDLGDDVNIGWRTQINLADGGRIGDNLRLGRTSYNVDLELNMLGGSIGDGLSLQNDSVSRVSGGVIGDNFIAQIGSFITLVGDDFRVDGVPVEGLDNVGDSVVMSQNGVTYSGVLADGSAFAFALGRTDRRSNLSSFTFERADVVATPPGEVVVSSAMAPLAALRDQTVRVESGGVVAKNFMAASGSTVVVSQGGSIGRNFEAIGADVRLNGGVIGDSLELMQGTGLMIEGGSLGDGVYSTTGGPVAIYGESFQLAGVEVQGLSQPGDQVHVGDVLGLTGVLGDGTPIILHPSDNDQLQSVGVTLHYRAAPAAVPGVFVASSNPGRLSVRGGQSFVVDTGSTVGPHFVAGRGSTVTVQSGATVGRNLEALNAQVNIYGGSVGPAMDAFEGSTVVVNGGSIGEDFYASDSDLTLNNSSLGDNAYIVGDSHMQINGGVIGKGLRLENGGSVTITDGTTVNEFSAWRAQTVEISGGDFPIGLGSQGDVRINQTENTLVSGGSIKGSLRVTGGPLVLSGGRIEGKVVVLSQTNVNGALPTSLRLVGDDFRVNGVKVTGLDSVGSTATGFEPIYGAVTGTLADGTPFAFSPFIDFDGIGPPESLTFERAELPVITSTRLDASTDPLGWGIRSGQTLVVPAGATVEANYNAGADSRVILEAGGTIGENFEAGGAVVEVRGGTLAPESDFFGGATLNVYDGTIGHGMDVANSTVNLFGGTLSPGGPIDWGASAYLGAVINVYDGADARNLRARNGGTVNIRGGLVANAQAIRGGFLNITGGEVDSTSSYSVVSTDSSVVTISGGKITKDISVGNFGELYLYGSGFAIDGQSITPAPGESMVIDERSSRRLTASLADGEAFELRQLRFISDLATLTIANYTIGDFNGDGLVDLSDRDAWRTDYGLAVDVAGQGSDGNFDGLVDAADYTIWRDAYNAALDATAVPEPNAAVLLLVTMAASLFQRCR